MSFGSIKYLLYAFFFFLGGGWGVHTFFCDVTCKLGGGSSANQVEMYEDNSPIKNVDKGKMYATLGRSRPLQYTFLRGWGAKTYQNPRKITFKYENLSKS